MTNQEEHSVLPRIGMVATVRNRRGIVSCVRPFDGPEGRLHLVDLEYNDGESPLEESLVWEREPFARVLPPSALPEPPASDPMPHIDLTALVRACRWSARTPYVDPDGSGPLDRLPVTAPFHGAVQVEDYQLVPLLKALRMPRVSLLIGDDVGLGKTIEAGMILTELLLRRRVRKVLIMTPASLRLQWRDELWTKFSLPFDVVDRDSTIRLRRELGMDANPWRSHSRIITSYYYLRQPDVLEEFLSAGRSERDDAQLPWDLLIVDEAHNLTPTPFGDESDLCKMLRQVAPLFEHRLFLTATPHNGHTRSFTGLLELLDPVRFSQSDELKPAERGRVQDVLVRRLKREINERSTPKRFCDRLPPQALMIELSQPEKDLSEAFDAFRTAVRKLVSQGGRRRRLAGRFAIEILGKRLLSCPTAFAESWRRCRAGMAEEQEAGDAEVLAAQKSVHEEQTDDREAESRSKAASETIGAWLKPLAAQLTSEVQGIDCALGSLGLLTPALEVPEINPAHDARFDALVKLIEDRLRKNGKWLADERLVLFTEYKTTLDYLLRRLRERWASEPGRFLCLYGGMDDADREDIKAAFNNPDNEVRILVGTDAASEGLNLQETARYILHFDVPWSPARVEQRNGRLDRHGQARDVSTWHFVSADSQDLAFLDLVVRKVHTIREDLGATGEVFDELTYRRLVEGESLANVQRDLDLRVDAARKQGDIPRDSRIETQEQRAADELGLDLAAIAAELDFDPGALRETLDAAMAIRAGRPRIGEPDVEGFSTIVQPHPLPWSAVIDDTVRLPSRAGVLGALPRIAFDPSAFIQEIHGRPIFRPKPGTLLVHLGHPLLQRALSALTRQRFPGGTELAVSRWTAYRDGVDPSLDAVLQLTVEELAVNELRETFHHWVRTIRIPIEKGRLRKPLPHSPATALRRQSPPGDPKAAEIARDLWADVEPDVKVFLREASAELTALLKTQIEQDRARALEEETQRFKSRHGELSTLIESNTMKRLDAELAALRERRQQGLLFNQVEEFDAIDRDINLKEEELKRRRQHYEELRDQLARERERVINNLIPKRFAIRAEAQVMPVAVEIILPGGKG